MSVETGALGPRPPIGWLTKTLYATGAAANQIKAASLSMLLLLFYNQVVGLDPRVVSSAILITMFVDSFVDPTIGQISDNFRSKLGRRHPFMYFAAFPVSITFFLIWNPPMHWSHGAIFAWMLTCLLILRAFDAELGHRPPNPWLDLEPLAAVLHPKVRARSLDEWMAQMGIQCAVRHQAAADTLATAELLQKLWPAALREMRGKVTFAGASQVAAQRRWLT